VYTVEENFSNGEKYNTRQEFTKLVVCVERRLSISTLIVFLYTRLSQTHAISPLPSSCFITSEHTVLLSLVDKFDFSNL
jgi:hypothetical protein